MICYDLLCSYLTTALQSKFLVGRRSWPKAVKYYTNINCIMVSRASGRLQTFARMPPKRNCSELVIEVPHSEPKRALQATAYAFLAD